MEADVNSIIVHVSAIVSIFGILSGLVVGHHYTRNASGNKTLTRTEFNRGTILFAGAMFIASAGIGFGMLIINFLEPEPGSVFRAIVISCLCLILPPLFAAAVFMSELRRKVR